MHEIISFHTKKGHSKLFIAFSHHHSPLVEIRLGKELSAVKRKFCSQAPTQKKATRDKSRGWGGEGKSSTHFRWRLKSGQVR
jgi:hypothetical protein